MPDVGLKWNDHDRSFSLMIKTRPEDGKARRKKTVKIEEPNVDELGEVQSILDSAEEVAPPVDGMDPNADDANDEVRRVNDEMTARTASIYVSDKPFADAVVKVIELLGDGSYVPDRGELPGFCSSPATLQTMIAKWRDPLVG